MRPGGIPAGAFFLAARRTGGEEELGAGNGVRTRDIQLGKLTLYQLSYARPGTRNIAEPALPRQRLGGCPPLDGPLAGLDNDGTRGYHLWRPTQTSVFWRFSMRAPAYRAFVCLVLFSCGLFGRPEAGRAASYLPLSDDSLARRAPIIVRAQVVSQTRRLDAVENEALVVTRTALRVLEVLKGEMASDPFFLDLPGGQIGAMTTWYPGTPEFTIGGEVLLFLAPAGVQNGLYALTELGLSKFDVVQDATGRRFATRPVFSDDEDRVLSGRSKPAVASPAGTGRSLRDADTFLSSLRSLARGENPPSTVYAVADGDVLSDPSRARPLWVNLGGAETSSTDLYRWFWETGASPEGVVSVSGTQSNLSDGSTGATHVQRAVDAWSSVASSDVRYSFAPSSGNVVVFLDVDAHSSAWSAPLGCNQGGVIGYGGPGSSASAPSFKGDRPYYAIPSGTIWIRHLVGADGCYPAATFEAAVLHEMGHTLGLGHPDENASVHSTLCPFATCTAVMRSTLTEVLTPQADDIAGIQWYYGTQTPVSAPAASFVAPAVALINDTVAFTDTSAGTPTSWAWSFGDGGVSTQRSPTHVYSAPGAYAVRLTASNAGGSGIANRTVTVATCFAGSAVPCRAAVAATSRCCRGPRDVTTRPAR